MSNIFEDLGFKNLEPGDLQSVDEMTVVPIVGRDRTQNVARPENLRFSRTREYGSMEFTNVDPDNDAIVPTNTVVISEKAAQDHAMSSAGVVESDTAKTFDNACCVQQTQGGLLTEEENTYDILPMELRKALLSPTLRFQRDYDKLWPAINSFLSGIPGIETGRGHLEYFFRPYYKELEDFAAEFEPVDGQIGALVFFTNTLVGVELMPTVSHWFSYWKWLIRGCYGAQLLKLKLMGKIKPTALSVGNLPKDISQLASYVENSLRALGGNMFQTLNYVRVREKTPYKLTEKPYMYGTLLSTKTGGGDLIVQSGEPIYLSMVV